MKKFSTLITERKGEKAHREAEAMGLKYKGFGYWVDPNSGEVTHKTEGDQLVAVTPDVETEKCGGDGPEQGGMPGMGGGGAPGGAPGAPEAPGQQAPQQALGQNVLGTAEPGMAQAPKRMTWEPGPDGDHCVDSEQPKEEVPVDTFVGKTNYDNWDAGPDGTNYSNLSLDNFKKIAEQFIGEGKFTREMDRNQSADQKIADIKRGRSISPVGDITHGKLQRMMKRGTKNANDLIAADLDGIEKVGDHQGPKRPLNHPGPGTLMRQAMGAQKVDPAWENELGPIRDAVKDAKKGGNDVALGNQIAQMMAIRNNQEGKGEGIDATFDQDEKKRGEMFKKLIKMPAHLKDAEAVKQMNAEVGPMMSDPKFDLDQFDDDDFDDGGAFGDVAVTDDHVIKKGRIGPEEMKALFAMKDNPQFPTLVNGRFDGPFKHQSSEYNNPIGKPTLARPQEGQDSNDYWDPEDQSEFDDRYPSAPGTYAMTRAQGEPAHNVMEDMDDEGRERAMKSFWKARAALHMKGFSHNDMHGGNIFVDDDGNSSIIDLGLAQDDPLSALMEGLGGADYEQGEDTQLSHHFSGSNLPEDMRESLLGNMESVREMIQDQISVDPDDYDDYDADQDYSPTMTGKTQTMEDMMRGGIRMPKERLDAIKEAIPGLGDNKQVMKMIQALYKGIGEDSLEQRMSDGFDKNIMSPKDQKTFRAANALRKQDGYSPIKGKHFDFDD